MVATGIVARRQASGTTTAQQAAGKGAASVGRTKLGIVRVDRATSPLSGNMAVAMFGMFDLARTSVSQAGPGAPGGRPFFVRGHNQAPAGTAERQSRCSTHASISAMR
jgi:hypothetical protein